MNSTHVLDTLALYKLSLSLGVGIDFHENISHFLLALLNTKKLSYVSLWLYENEEDKNSTEIRLLFSHPTAYFKNFASPSDKYFLKKLRNSEVNYLHLSNHTENPALENLPESGALAFIPLGELGFLKIYDESRNKTFAEEELKQLKPIFHKFSQSLEVFISYQHNRNALNEKSYSEMKFRSIINAAMDAFIIFNADGHILEWNKQAQTIFGFSREEVLGDQLENIIIPHEYCHAHKIMIKALIQPKNNKIIKQRIEIVVLNRLGKTFPIEFSIVPVKTNQGYIFCGYIRDITLRKKEEEKQKKLLDKLEIVNHELNDFAHVVSHDLKAPLRAIKNLSDCIYADYESKLGKEGQQLFELLKNRVDRMKGLINGILEYSRMGRLNSEEKVVNLAAELEELIEVLDPPENIHIAVTGKMPHVFLNEVSIMQVFQNLISNAIKYIDKPLGEIEIGCREEEENICFWVKDNGPGIAKKYRARIFKIFETLENTQSYESTGVGLAIVKKILSHYQGEIWLESTLGEGSSFYFTLPNKRIVSQIKHPVQA